VQQLIRLRGEHASFKSVDLQWLHVDPQANTMLFKKTAESESLFVAINASDVTQRLLLPDDLARQPVLDLLRGELIEPGKAVNLPAFGFRLWTC
jgi:hypothetical protein